MKRARNSLKSSMRKSIDAGEKLAQIIDARSEWNRAEARISLKVHPELQCTRRADRLHA
jgi:hypothetical protein